MSRKKQQEFVVIGLGRFGYNLAVSLEEHGHTVMAIDVNPLPVQSIVDHVTHAAALDSTDENALQAIDIASFDIAVVAIGSDFEANLLTTTNLKALGVRHVICKTQTNRQSDILLRLGADKIIQPEHDSANRLADELSIPAMIEYFSLGDDYSVAEIILPHSLAWQSMAQSAIRNTHHITVLLIKRGEEVLISPTADTVLQEGDMLIIFGKNKDINAFSSLA